MVSPTDTGVSAANRERSAVFGGISVENLVCGKLRYSSAIRSAR